MSKTRISIKLNEYEYSSLYRVQLSCIMPGLSYNRTPPLNEIVHALISYVFFDVTYKIENLDSFFKNITMDSEYPHHFYESPSKVPTKAGNYIFFADDDDIEMLKKIGDALFHTYSAKYDLPKLIRHCIHYTLYGDGFLLKGPTKKAEFVVLIMLGNLYGISPRLIVELMKNPLLQTISVNDDEKVLLQRIPIDESVFNTAKANLAIGQEGVSEYQLSKEAFKRFIGSRYNEYDSRVSDFNFISLFFGLSLVTYMWENDSFDWIKTNLFMWSSTVNRGKETRRKGHDEVDYFPPPAIIYSLIFVIKTLDLYFAKLMTQCKKHWKS